ncbi:MAG: hypothetical protein ACQEQD_08430 [Bacillota bacterium]
MQKLKKYLFLGSFFLLLVVFLASCSNDSQITITENFAGSGGPGDFYKITLNMTDYIIEYDNLTINESGKESFKKINNNLYEIEKDAVYFAKLNDEILIVGDTTGNDEEGLLTAVKERKTEYANDIDGIYNVATSLEGWVGIVEIDTANNKVNVEIDTNYDDSAFEEILTDMDYSYNSKHDAIEINENESFRHFGVFIDNEIGIFDSYMWDNNDWVGDGMFILVKQDTNVDLSNYAGDYYSVDKDGTVIPFKLNYNSDSEELEISVEGEPTGTSISADNELTNIPGVFEFEIKDDETGSLEKHRAIFLPGKAMVVAYEGFEGEDGSPGLFVGIKAD